MGKRVLALASILVLAISTTVVQSEYYSESVPYKQVHEKVTHLHFFMHDTISGNDPSAVLVARANITAKQPGPTPFSTVFAVDDPLTEGPDLTSRVIGNARGLYVSASKDENLTLVMYVDYGFTTGKYKGSSISVFSRNPITYPHREVAVVGGRGLFRMARGYVKVTTHYLNFTNGDAVLEYNAVIVHP